MNYLLELDDIEFATELFDAYREKGVHPDEYQQFLTPVAVEDRTIDAFSQAIDRIKTQLDAHLLLDEEREPDWVVRAKGAKRHYERERYRITRERQRRNIQARKQRAASNHALYSEQSRKLHDLLEVLALKVEELGGSLDGLVLPSHDEQEIVSVEDWLDMREERKQLKAERDG